MNSLSLGDLTTTGKGAKQIPLRCKDGLLKFQPGPLRVLWQPQAYNEPTATRVSICFEATREMEDYMHTLDEWVIKALSADFQRLFGTTVNVDQMREKYTSSLKTSQKVYKHMKAKVSIAGRGIARFWSPGANKPGPPPEDWTNCVVEPIMEIRGVWFLGKEVGLLVELTDALVTENSVAYPFA